MAGGLHFGKRRVSSVGMTVVVETFYRARQKVGLLVGGDAFRLEIKLETAQKELRRAPAPG